jgi:hypothetical protein
MASSSDGIREEVPLRPGKVSWQNGVAIGEMVKGAVCSDLCKVPVEIEL